MKSAMQASAWSRLHQVGSILKRCSVQQSLCHTSSSPPTHHPGLQVKVTPKVSLFDDKVDIRVQGLLKEVKVTLHIVLECQWRQKPVHFVSCGHYVSDQEGCVDVGSDASSGGTYTGVEPMGLLWSMEPSPAGAHGIRMVIRDVEQPLTYHLSVYQGHLSLKQLHLQKPTPRPVTKTTFERYAKDRQVRRIPVKEGNIRGTLFLPPGEGPFRGVIDMFGIAGGLMEGRGAMLASRGFAALSLAFFNYQDLPPSVEMVKLDYFEEALTFLTSHPAVKPGGVGVVAVSGGASLALLMGWQFPQQVLAVVAINSPRFHAFYDLYHGSRLVRKGAMLDREHAPLTEEGLVVRDSWIYTTENIIPIWESPTRFMLLQSDDDHQVWSHWGDVKYSMYPAERQHLIQVVHYPGAGHLLEPPYTPLCRFCFNSFFGMDLLWGGYKEEHAKAQEDSWIRIIDFLNTHLP